DRQADSRGGADADLRGAGSPRRFARCARPFRRVHGPRVPDQGRRAGRRRRTGAHRQDPGRRRRTRQGDVSVAHGHGQRQASRRRAVRRRACRAGKIRRRRRTAALAGALHRASGPLKLRIGFPRLQSAGERSRIRAALASNSAKPDTCTHLETGLLPVGIPRRMLTSHGGPPGKRGILAELSYRHVWRAAAVYVGAVWALSQGIAQLAPVFHAPDWVTRWFVIACAIGFPFWVAFSWYYKLTPEGLKLESDVTTPHDQGFHRATGRKMDLWIIGVMAVAIVLLVTNTFVLHRDANSAANATDAKTIAAELAKIPFKSVAVLPLANESGDPKQQYFSDGLSEELISDLTQINGLKVIGKYSSFKFRDSTESPAQIGVALGVAHLIQGSVRQQGDRIRVTLSMISAKDGSSVWSNSYDELLKDVFAIQSKIGDAVADALKVKLLGKTIVASDKPPS